MKDIEDLAVYGKKHLLVLEDEIDYNGVDKKTIKQFIKDLLLYIQLVQPSKKDFDKYINKLSGSYNLKAKPNRVATGASVI